jgi:NitT/TauT family transport system substrate-binding protein
MKLSNLGRTVALTTAALLAAASLASCSSDNGGTNEPGGDSNGTATVRIGSIPVTDAAILVQGDNNGFFKDEGLKPDFGNPAAGGSSIVAAIIAGEYEIGYSATLSIFQAVEGGNDLVMIAPAVGSYPEDGKGTNDLITDPKLGFKTAKDLEGNRYGVNTIFKIEEKKAR